MALPRPNDSEPRLKGFRIKRRYLIALVVLLSINALVMLVPGANWNAGWVGQFLFPILGQALIVVGAVAVLALAVAGIRIFLAKSDD
jgi:hypothetical protein